MAPHEHLSISSSFLSRMRSKSDEERNKAAHELYKYISGELKESPNDVQQLFIDNFDENIFKLTSSNDPNDQKAGILSIVCLINVSNTMSATNTRQVRFLHYMRNLVWASDQNVDVTRLAAKTIGEMANAAGDYTAVDSANYELKKAYEYLGKESSMDEMRKLAAVIVLRELAHYTPTLFYQGHQQFFELIFNAIKDSRANVREGGVAALRAALGVVSRRELKQEQKGHVYQKKEKKYSVIDPLTQQFVESGFNKPAERVQLCFEKAVQCFTEAEVHSGHTREDRVHAGLLIFNELVRVAREQPIDPTSLKEEIEGLEKRNILPKKKNKTDKSVTSGFRRYVMSQKAADDPISRVLAVTKFDKFESKTCCNQVNKNFNEICRLCIQHKNLKSPICQAVLLQLLPRLAAFDSEEFTKLYLGQTVPWLLQGITKNQDRTGCFIALGLITLSVRDKIGEHLSKIFEVIRTSLPTAKDVARKKHQADPAVFTCIRLLARALGPSIESQIHNLLDLMFAARLSPALTVSLKEIVVHIPSLKTVIHDGILYQLSLTLMHRRMPPKDRPPPPIYRPHGPVVVNDVGAVTLALSVLGNFEFQSGYLDRFLIFIADGYLSSDRFEVRQEAVTTCCALLLPKIRLVAEMQDTASPKRLDCLDLIHEILAKILTVGVTDPDSNIRYCAFTSFSTEFDSHLAQPESLGKIFMALQDEAFEIRQAVIALLGRLGQINPAYVLPTLRNVLIQIREELDHSGIGRNMEQSADLLSQLVASSPNFMVPYVPAVLKTLIPKLKDSECHQDVTISVLNSIGELAKVGGPELLKHIDTLMPLLIDLLQDNSNIEKRKVALWTFGQIVESTGYVIEPYKTYPELLDLLTKFLKTEQLKGIRREAIRVLGILGALDPYKRNIYMGTIDTAANSTGLSLSMPDPKNINQDRKMEIIQWFHWEKCSLEEFYPAIAIVSLLHIVHDPSLAEHHNNVVQAMMHIFNSLNSKCVPYIEQVVPSFLMVIKTCEPSFQKFLFQQFGNLVGIVKHHIKPYLKDIFALIKEVWTPRTSKSNISHTIIQLIEHMVKALGPDFRPYIPDLMPHLLKVFLHDDSKDKVVIRSLLKALRVCTAILEEYLHLVIPPILKLVEHVEMPSAIRAEAIDTLNAFTDFLNLSHYSSRIIHPMLRLLSDLERPELEVTAGMNLLCSLAIQMGDNFLIFEQVIDSAIQSRMRSNTPGIRDDVRRRYNLLISTIKRNHKIGEDDDEEYKRRQLARRSALAVETQIPAEVEVKKLQPNTSVLKSAWSVQRCVSKDDWLEWLKRFSLQLLVQSPFPSLRSCGRVAKDYQLLARDLFNASFMSCWTELDAENQDNLSRCLKKALQESEIPEIIQTILNLAEFMDHSDKGPLSIEPAVLGQRALKSRAYAKALRYIESNFSAATSPDKLTEHLEALISVNNKLQLSDESKGVVEYAKSKGISSQEIRERWYEKLQEWDKALLSYETKHDLDHKNFTYTLGRMRCLEALSEWDKLFSIGKAHMDIITPADYETHQQEIHRLLCAASWGLKNWEEMGINAEKLNKNTFDGALYKSVLGIHLSDYKEAQDNIDKARDLIDTELSSVAGESYNRAYKAMVQVQMLSELEEAIQFKLVPDRRASIKQIWCNRLTGVQTQVEDWQRLLSIRSLVLEPKDMQDTWLKFASLCRKNNRMQLSQKTLRMLIGDDIKSVAGRDDTTCVDLPSLASSGLLFTQPRLVFCYAKHLWDAGEKMSADALLTQMMEAWRNARSPKETEALNESPDFQRLFAKCYLKLGLWKEVTLRANRSSEVCGPLEHVIQFYRAATECDRQWYKAWHALARCHYDATLFYQSLINKLPVPAPFLAAPTPVLAPPIHPATGMPMVGPPPLGIAVPTQHSQLSAPPIAVNNNQGVLNNGLAQSAVPVPQEVFLSPHPSLGGQMLSPAIPGQQLPPGAISPIPQMAPEYVAKRRFFEETMVFNAVCSVNYFFRSIALSPGNNLQDTLRLLTLLFDYGRNLEVYEALSSGMKTVPIETWLQVIPQLIARIDTPQNFVSRFIKDLLKAVSREHPQSLVYPLTVSSKSLQFNRQQAAKTILKHMVEKTPKLVEDAQLISKELIRVAILWHELWHEGLEEASRMHFAERNVQGMFNTLEPLHNMIDQTPETMNEIAFNQAYYRDLKEAREWCSSFQQTGNVKDLTKAWDLYYHVFRRISKQLPQLTNLELEYVSPELKNSSNLELAVPGTYDPNRPLVSIHSVHTNLQVITSKQRPRKICIKGSDGLDYWFLLKGHEDPRQDERVMQLFGLVNGLLLQNPATCRNNLAIQRYSIIPLSQNSGLIGWVPNSDTLHALLRDFREKKKVLLNIEHKIMQRMAPDYDHLTVMQKVEVFEHALTNTTGDDLARIFWLKSPSSEVWFDRRTNYTRSLAVMSMVGYILGLGDRHPSNLMLDRMSGKIVHIDFGDCFEVAINREKFPEKIPFRLTRMLEKAMEVTGIEGNYRMTCERVMSVLRDNADSLMAVLEAFVYDPLINWRILDTNQLNKKKGDGSQQLGGFEGEPGGMGEDGKVPGMHPAGAPKVPEEAQTVPMEVRNKKAIEIIQRIKDKLAGKDFVTVDHTLTVPNQVELLIQQARSHENLCQCYIGWCPFW